MPDVDDPEHELPRVLDRSMNAAEDVVYAIAAVLLLAGAVTLLVATGYRLAADASDGVQDAVISLLDSLLLVFILVELLGAVRATVRERRLVAEPFLLVGMIASIKEIVIEAVRAREYVGTGDKFNDSMVSIGVLSGVLVALGVTTLLLRRKEREPEE